MKQALRWPAYKGLIVGIGILAAFFVALICYSQVAQAAPPPSTMNFQGRLANSAGTAMPNGSYNMQFRIYDDVSGGTAVWQETRQTTNRVDIQNGLFSVQLGEVTALPASVFSNPDLYFEITMATPATATCDTASCATWESPMTPRSKLATSAYAFNAANAATLDGQSASDFAAASGSANYVQNTTSPQTASFNISGSGTVAGAFLAGGISTFNGEMSVNNIATFRSNSTTAFRLQNAAGTATLFTADTSNKIIAIGNPSEVTFSPTVLVLDRSDSSSDPTGYQGAMYYNAVSHQFRCYQSSAWKNCDSNTKGTPVVATSHYTAKTGDFVLADADVNPLITITLPAPAAGATVSVKKVSSGGAITVSGGGVNIDGAPNDSLTTQWHSQDYFSDGTKWYKV